MQVKDQARRLAQLEEMLKEAQLRPVARRRCLEGEQDGSASLERQVNSVTQELQVRVQKLLNSPQPIKVLCRFQAWP